MAQKSPFPGITSCERFDLASCDSPDKAPEVEGILKLSKLLMRLIALELN